VNAPAGEHPAPELPPYSGPWGTHIDAGIPGIPSDGGTR
jgi:hypothetical protein